MNDTIFLDLKLSLAKFWTLKLSFLQRNLGSLNVTGWRMYFGLSKEEFQDYFVYNFISFNQCVNRKENTKKSMRCVCKEVLYGTYCYKNNFFLSLCFVLLRTTVLKEKERAVWGTPASKVKVYLTGICIYICNYSLCQFNVYLHV